MTHSTPFTASRQNLWRQLVNRALVRLLQVAALIFAGEYLQLDLRYVPLLATLLITIGATAYAARLLRGRREPSDGSFVLQLLADIVQLTLFLYFSGGATNPFVSYYLVPLCISAAVLPIRFTWFIALVSLAAYSTLIFAYDPVMQLEMRGEHAHHDAAMGTFNAHVLGMWINFLLSAMLIANFVTRMAATLRRQQIALAQAREQAMQQEQVIAVATLAAGTAHELGTPLATMTMLAEELQAGDDRAQQQEDLRMLQVQLQRCREILHKLSTTAEFGADRRAEVADFRQFIHATLEHWMVTHPHEALDIDENAGCDAAPQVLAGTIVQQALVNLLNNAARAARSAVRVSVNCSSDGGTLVIRDDGPGIPDKVIAQLGQPLADGEGMGIGLLLAHAAIRQRGGELTLTSQPGGGTRARVFLPALQESGPA